MLDSPEGVCAGQTRFEYPATFVLFSNLLTSCVLLPGRRLGLHGQEAIHKAASKLEA